jgi:ferritin-like metal-binding protein YciE
MESLIIEILRGQARCATQLLYLQFKVEHYEIATYVTIHQFAKKIGLIEVAELLEVTPKKKATDNKLSEVATTAINVDLAERNYNTFKTSKMKNNQVILALLTALYQLQ